MATLITKSMDKLLALEYEDFTGYIITAIAMAELNENFSKKDLSRLHFLRDNTHEKLGVSIFVLDRKIDPTAVTGDATKYNYPIKFKSETLVQEGDPKEFKMMSDTIQKYLCNAINEVATIIFRNFKKYNDERAFPDFGKGGKDSEEEDFIMG